MDAILDRPLCTCDPAPRRKSRSKNVRRAERQLKQLVAHIDEHIELAPAWMTQEHIVARARQAQAMSAAVGHVFRMKFSPTGYYESDRTVEGHIIEGYLDTSGDDNDRLILISLDDRKPDLPGQFIRELERLESFYADLVRKARQVLKGESQAG